MMKQDSKILARIIAAVRDKRVQLGALTGFISGIFFVFNGGSGSTYEASFFVRNQETIQNASFYLHLDHYLPGVFFALGLLRVLNGCGVEKKLNLKLLVPCMIMLGAISFGIAFYGAVFSSTSYLFSGYLPLFPLACVWSLDVMISGFISSVIFLSGLTYLYNVNFNFKSIAELSVRSGVIAAILFSPVQLSLHTSMKEILFDVALIIFFTAWQSIMMVKISTWVIAQKDEAIKL